jgi:predicted RNA-binding Zn-ribbon protein involved in translation (DUF1610 family)
MGKLINLAEKKEEQLPHNSGKAFCLICKHEWIAVAPAGVVWMECPKCGSEKGIFKYACLREDDPHWTCHCGNDLFYVTPRGYYCPNCGEWQTGF